MCGKIKKASETNYYAVVVHHLRSLVNVGDVVEDSLVVGVIGRYACFTGRLRANVRERFFRRCCGSLRSGDRRHLW